MRTYALVIVWILSLTSLAFAEKVEFPDEELATETVLPKFDRPMAVKNRNVTTAQRTELGVFAGWNLNEPFYNNQQIGVNGTYHFTEVSGLNLSGSFFMSGLSTYSNQLRDQYALDFSKAPGPKAILLGHYQFTTFYGKMSLTKQSVMNLSLYGLIGGGIVSYSGYNSPALSVGFGEKFYFTPDFGLRVDMRFFGIPRFKPVNKGFWRQYANQKCQFLRLRIVRKTNHFRYATQRRSGVFIISKRQQRSSLSLQAYNFSQELVNST